MLLYSLPIGGHSTQIPVTSPCCSLLFCPNSRTYLLKRDNAEYVMLASVRSGSFPMGSVPTRAALSPPVCCADASSTQRCHGKDMSTKNNHQSHSEEHYNQEKDDVAEPDEHTSSEIAKHTATS